MKDTSAQARDDDLYDVTLCQTHLFGYLASLLTYLALRSSGP